MNPELQKELLSWLQALKEAVGTGAAFAAQQIPQVLWEKILLDRVYYTTLVFLFLLAGTLILFKGRKGILAWGERHADESDGLTWLASYLALVVSAVIPLLVFLANGYDLAMVWFAPRLYLIEWLKEMVKPS